MVNISHKLSALVAIAARLELLGIQKRPMIQRKPNLPWGAVSVDQKS